MTTATTATGEKRLELTVQNFGPIAEGTVELRPLTVFVGPSNTGKSYLATLIYALHKSFDGADYLRVPRGLLRSRSSGDLGLTESDVAEISDWVDTMLVDEESTSRRRLILREFSEPIELPERIGLMTRTVINNVSELSKALREEIARCFAIDQVENLSGHYREHNGSMFSLRGNFSGSMRDKNSWRYKLVVSGQESGTDTLLSEKTPLRITKVEFPRLLAMGQPKRREIEASALVRSIARTIASDVVAPLSSPAYYLPADRAGVMHAHRVVVRALIANASRATLHRELPLPVLSGVLGDFLEQLLDLADYRIDGDYDGLATHLETKIMRGDIGVEKDQIDYPSFIYRPHGWQHDLPLMNASSMVSELAPVVLYLRYVVEPGETLIIEEPESHLHPAMQVEFIRVLAAAVKAGVRIIITTHSEWVLEELANLVRLSELSPERRNGIEDPGIALGHDEVGAWFFEPNAEDGGSVVREIPLDTESGTFPAGYGLVTESLYKRWSMINRRVRKAQ